jgi:hypothetical protein
MMAPRSGGRNSFTCFPAAGVGAAFFFLKKRLLDFTVNAYEPIFRMGGTVTKMNSLGLQFSLGGLWRISPRLPP